MIPNQKDIYISLEDYLAGEEVSPIKHEYKCGEVYAIAGASKAHVTISVNTVSLLRNHLRGSGCFAYMADMKLRVETADAFYYPDVMVSCDERDRTSTRDFIHYPSLIIEVLSPKTAAFDRGEKFADYRTIETLQEYVLINQERVSVECFRRNEVGLWVLHPYQAGDEIYLASVDFHTPIAAIYEDVIGLSGNNG